MAEKMYSPNQLEPVSFLREGKSWITGQELFARSAELGAVEGKEQADFLWERREEFPEEWRRFWLVVPDPAGRVLRVFDWGRFYQRWFRGDDRPDSSFYGRYRLLRPSE